ncbi:hypothetical protein M0804_008383 [Polistes exclamans]|nr:hypothetical protein M0804_008383 [Polistes exclamans]
MSDSIRDVERWQKKKKKKKKKKEKTKKKEHKASDIRRVIVQTSENEFVSSPRRLPPHRLPSYSSLSLSSSSSSSTFPFGVGSSTLR